MKVEEVVAHFKEIEDNIEETRRVIYVLSKSDIPYCTSRRYLIDNLGAVLYAASVAAHNSVEVLRGGEV